MVFLVENLKKLRIKHKISQKQLADVIGVSQQSINKYENHNIEPDIDTLKSLANYFNTSIDYLVGYSNKNTSDINSELLYIFNQMTSDQKRLFIEQGKVFIRINNEKNKKQQ